MAETLLQYLRRPNPKIIHMKRRNNNRSVTRNTQYVSPKYVQRWKEIQTKVLESTCSEVLQHIRKRAQLNSTLRSYEIQNEDGLGDVVLLCNQEIVTEALSESQECFGRSEKIQMIRGFNAAKPEDSSSRYKPDWATIIKTSESEDSDEPLPKYSIMPGDSKYSRHWKSAEIEEGPCDFGGADFARVPDWFWPLTQIYSYCKSLKTRYGYLITDEELVVVRVGPHADAPTNGPRTKGLEIHALGADGMLEFASIPWCNGRTEEGHEIEEGNGMSVNTALWWLHVLAASDHSIQWTYPPLEDERYQPARRDSVRSDSQTNLARELPPRDGDNNDSFYHSFQGGHEQQYEFSVPETGPSTGAARNRRIGRPGSSSPEYEGLGNRANVSFSQTSVASGVTDTSERSTRAKRKRDPDNSGREKAGARGKRKKK